MDYLTKEKWQVHMVHMVGWRLNIPRARVAATMVVLIILMFLLTGCNIVDQLGNIGDSIGDMLKGAFG